jgi:hypothetical protein
MYFLIKMEIYSYNELFNLIKEQMEQDKTKKKAPSYMENLLSSGLRTVNNPTLQNLNNTGNIFLNSNKREIKPDDRSKYIYLHQNI